jgi:zinc transport system substrate-binding protein
MDIPESSTGIIMRRLDKAALAFGLALLLAGPAEAASGLKVLTSILPLKEFTAAVAGGRAEVTLLLPPGAGVHTWQPRPADIMRLAGCDLFVAVGADLEPWLGSVLEAVPGRHVRVLEVAQGLPLLKDGNEGEPETVGESHHHGSLDPHIWLDFGLDAAIIDRIVEALAELDPEGRASYTGKGAIIKERLEALDGDFRSGLATCRTKRLVVAGHAAFGYLARRYGLVQTAVYGLSPDAEAKPRRMMSIIDLCREEGIKAVFQEAASPPALASSLAREIGGRVLLLSTGVTLTRAEIKAGAGFFEVMRENLTALREGLNCR